MKRSDITDRDVLIAYADARRDRRRETRGQWKWPYEILSERFGCPEKVAFSAMERAAARGLIEYGVSLRSGWITPEGIKVLESEGSEDCVA